MKKKLLHKLTAAACAFILLLSLAPAVYAADAQPATSSNINGENYGTWASTVKSYLYENSQGGLTRVEYIADNDSIVVEDYNSSFQLQSSRTIPMELSIWGGFFAGQDYNFFVFGQANPDESDSVETFRIVKYSKDWRRLDQASLYGANTTDPFSAGSLRCAACNGYLYIRTCHKMYKSEDGRNHQANVMILLRQSDMTITDSFYLVEWGVGYVSHSFNQFILIDTEGRIVALDHGDAYPRSAFLQRYKQTAGQDSFRTYTGSCEEAELVTFPGDIGQNFTGASLGGLAETRSGYVTAYNYDGNSAGEEERNVFLSYSAKDGLQSAATQVSASAGASTPVLVPTGLDGGYIMWNGKDGGSITHTLYYAAYDDSGRPGQVRTAEASLSDCQPICYNGKVVWYVTAGSAPVFYTLDGSGVSRHPAGGSDTPAEPSAPSAPSGSGVGIFPDVPATHWAGAQIQTCLERGIVAGFEDGAFGPNNSVTGAQFATMLDRMFYSEALTANTAYFGQTNGWYYPALYTADCFGMLKGTAHLADGARDNWKSSANQNLSRYDMAQMLSNIIADRGQAPDASALANARAAVSDFDRIPGGYQSAVATCIAAGVINGTTNGTFSGGENMTRAQACVVIERMLDFTGAGGGTPSGSGSNSGSGSESQTQPMLILVAPDLTVGQTGEIKAVPMGVDATPSITYASSDESVATVSNDGIVTAKKAGTAIITATMTWAGRSYTSEAEITVEAAPDATAAEELCAEVVRLVNEERAKEGLAPLGTFDTLTAAAQMRAPEIVTSFSHTRPDGRSCFTALEEAGVSGYYRAGENIAAGNSTAAATVALWMNSPGHRANILNENFTHIGVGYAESDSGYRYYWVQMFVGVSGS